MNITTILLTIVLGCFSGVLGGAFGMGGTAFILPILIITKIIPDYKTIIGTLLFALLPPLSLLAVIEYGKRKQINYTIGFILFITYFFGAYYGSMINKYYSNKTLIYGSAISLLLVSLSLFYIAYTLL
jgi:uncharacterized membrane protein YfcA